MTGRATCDLIAAEDTRHTQRLLQHFGIQTRVTAYHDHSDGRAIQRIADVLAGGGRVALVSDAGTPCVSDPGYRVVHEARRKGLTVRTVPGPSAALAALSVSGLYPARYYGR